MVTTGPVLLEPFREPRGEEALRVAVVVAVLCSWTGWSHPGADGLIRAWTTTNAGPAKAR